MPTRRILDVLTRPGVALCIHEVYRVCVTHTIKYNYSQFTMTTNFNLSRCSTAFWPPAGEWLFVRWINVNNGWFLERSFFRFSIGMKPIAWKTFAFHAKQLKKAAAGKAALIAGATDRMPSSHLSHTCRTCGSLFSPSTFYLPFSHFARCHLPSALWPLHSAFRTSQYKGNNTWLSVVKRKIDMN